jgi:hypothetical protein
VVFTLRAHVHNSFASTLIDRRTCSDKAECPLGRRSSPGHQLDLLGEGACSPGRLASASGNARQRRPDATIIVERVVRYSA